MNATPSGRVPVTVPGTHDSEFALPLHQPTTPTPTPITSSRGMALASRADRSIDDVLSLDRVVASIRPDWQWDAICAAIAADDRPWRTVVAASIRGALLDGPDTIRHPNGLRYVNPTAGTVAQPLPSPAELDRMPRCSHGAASGSCALCRNGIEP